MAPKDLVPQHCTGIAFCFEPGTLHIAKDGSGYLVVDECSFELRDDRADGPDGPEGSVHWLARIPAEEMIALQEFLNNGIGSRQAPGAYGQVGQSEAEAERVSEANATDDVDN